MEQSTPEVKIVSARRDKKKEEEKKKRTSAESRDGERKGEWRERDRRGEAGGWRRLGRPVRLKEVLVRRPAGKWKKKGACRLPEASLGPSVLSFRRQVFH